MVPTDPIEELAQVPAPGKVDEDLKYAEHSVHDGFVMNRAQRRKYGKMLSKTNKNLTGKRLPMEKRKVPSPLNKKDD